jgi:Protein of unknown function (DUF3099)
MRASQQRRERPQLVTEARRPMSEDIAYRERRYLIMMGIRLVCFVVAVLLFINGAGWLTAIPAVGAIIIPYFAVVFANGGREPSERGRFSAYEPNLPERYPPAAHPYPHRSSGAAEPGDSDITGSDGAPPRNS